MSEQQQQAPERVTWKVYADGLQTVGDAVIASVVIGAVLAVLALVIAAADPELAVVIWALVPVGTVIAFGAKLRMRGTEIKKGQQV